MLIGILSDTHDHKVNTKIALSMLRNLKAEAILHAGDYCAPFMIPIFEKWELHGVFGNNDGDHFRITQKFTEIGGHLHGEFMDKLFGTKRIAMYHGTQSGIIESLIRSRLYDVVITGHTHEAVNKVWTHPELANPEDGDVYKAKTLHVNPGTVNGLGGPATFALLDTNTGHAEIIGLD
ncbi:MAG: YfcE family phosphodiesterase [Balneolales bacterium]|nr:YfcE family phosphodiesterase [Balneolales bacterium]